MADTSTSTTAGATDNTVAGAVAIPDIKWTKEAECLLLLRMVESPNPGAATSKSWNKIADAMGPPSTGRGSRVLYFFLSLSTLP